MPGVVIHHSAASTGKYVGCPSIVVLPSGEYIASHSHFGPGSTNSRSFIYISRDRGKSWDFLTSLEGQIWSNLFIHNESLYIMGTDHCDRSDGRLNGMVVIRRSDDGGRTWTTPVDGATGLLTDQDGWHTAPCPVAVQNGRLYRAVEFAAESNRSTWCSCVLSAREDADLLNRKSWLFSEQFEHPWSESQWIEGNMVVAPDGAIINVLRENHQGEDREKAAEQIDRAIMLHVLEDGNRLHWRPEISGIDFPGGGVKFTIRYDSISMIYWALVNKQLDPPALRNRLYLSMSRDLRHWHAKYTLLEHEDLRYHAFQYVDWVFDRGDIVYVSRTAFDDGVGGAHSFHDANYLTFHRVTDFRSYIT